MSTFQLKSIVLTKIIQDIHHPLLSPLKSYFFELAGHE